MKKLTAAALAALLLLAGCAKDDKTIDTTTATADTIVTTVTTAETTVTGTVETEETTETTEAPVDLDALLEGYTVYDVTMDSYESFVKGLTELDKSERPEKIALKFTDLEGLMLLVEPIWTLDDYYPVLHIRKGDVDINVENNNYFRLDGPMSIEHKNGTIMFIAGSGSGDYTKYYIIQNNEYYILENEPWEDGYRLDIILSDNGEFAYSKLNTKYFVRDPVSLIIAYESDDDFYDEEGRVSFENGEAAFVTETVRTFGESGWSANEHIVKFYEIHGVTSIAELKAVYEQLLEEGRTSEFYGNE